MDHLLRTVTILERFHCILPPTGIACTGPSCCGTIGVPYLYYDRVAAFSNHMCTCVCVYSCVFGVMRLCLCLSLFTSGGRKLRRTSCESLCDGVSGYVHAFMPEGRTVWEVSALFSVIIRMQHAHTYSEHMCRHFAVYIKPVLLLASSTMYPETAETLFVIYMSLRMPCV